MSDKTKYRLHPKDTGSVPFQIVNLREEIEKNKLHLANNKKDVPVKRSLLKKIAKERRFFHYLKKRNPEIYENLKKELEKK